MEGDPADWQEGEQNLSRQGVMPRPASLARCYELRELLLCRRVEFVLCVLRGLYLRDIPLASL
jgi:hypothetical protein